VAARLITGRTGQILLFCRPLAVSRGPHLDLEGIDLRYPGTMRARREVIACAAAGGENQGISPVLEAS